MKVLAVLLLALPLTASEPVPGRFAVELEGEPLAAAAVSKAGLRTLSADARQRIGDQQRQAGARLAQAGARTIDGLTVTANVLLVEAPGVAREELAAIPGVRRVEAVYRIAPLLDRALPLARVPEAWNLAGGPDRAGAGIRIGIIDTGIDSRHPGFQDPSLPAPPGYPQAAEPQDAALANNKVIVVRNYERLEGLPNRSAQDRRGHGTSVAMVAAGVLNTGPLATIQGVAPRAWLGSYKVFPGDSEGARSDIILKAFDDAVADGMDVINLSLGLPFNPRPEDSILAGMIERAAALGVVVVASAGNSGPDPNTLASAAVAESVIAAGAVLNDRVFTASATVEGAAPFSAIPGDGPAPGQPVSAPLVDAAGLPGGALVCDPLPAGVLTGRIPLILRGVCLFSVKLTNAQAAGAAGALVYTHAESPEAITMATSGVTLPAMMVSHADGLRIKDLVAGGQSRGVTLDFRPGVVPVDARAVSAFSSRGPNSDLAIKPDLAAAGSSLYTASAGAGGSYRTVNGTSFSAPLIAGGAAVLMAARPGLSVREYRSLLINTARPFRLASGTLAPVQAAGAGTLDLEAALRGTVTAYPASLSFGAGPATISASRTLRLGNLGGTVETYLLAIEPQTGSHAPDVTPGSVQISPGSTGTVMVRLEGAGLAPGEYQGAIRILGSTSGVEARVPYWYAVPSTSPARITVLDASPQGRPGQLLRSAILFRVTEASGIALTAVTPTVTAVSGGGDVIGVDAAGDVAPGLFSASVLLGPNPGANVFRITVGGLSAEVTIQAVFTALERSPETRPQRRPEP